MIKAICCLIIKAYQLIVSPLLGSHCRFYPTCSNYALEAFKEYNLFKAVKLITIRLLRCNPWGGSGIDLLPRKNVKN